ncbi:hypothetical protein BD311DRAFT_748512 [Dichomitus squalens]|uniref:Uncharacterized protein n=1 Tax=Dichomitus squalens TaxID=114155 RepID=A0A4Q9MZ47_9APHY|nr:hypothetical protein BD311DRAFT_748512 [Dichomitus squalens]
MTEHIPPPDLCRRRYPTRTQLRGPGSRVRRPAASSILMISTAHLPRCPVPSFREREGGRP